VRDSLARSFLQGGGEPAVHPLPGSSFPASRQVGVTIHDALVHPQAPECPAEPGTGSVLGPGSSESVFVDAPVLRASTELADSSRPGNNVVLHDDDLPLPVLGEEVPVLPVVLDYPNLGRYSLESQGCRSWAVRLERCNENEHSFVPNHVEREVLSRARG